MFHSNPFQSLTNQASSPSSETQCLGFLQEKDDSGKVLNSRRLFAGHELIIGRDSNQCQYVLDDPVISNKHLRIYSVVYDGDKPNDVAPLVYAEDLSRNGTFWNGSLIGKGNGGFLLSDGDTLLVSARKLFVYRVDNPGDETHLFDLVQEQEMNHFRRDYIITDRVLGTGAYGRVHMAIEQSQRRQLACKIVDLRKLRPPSRTKFGSWERPAPAKDVDSRMQLEKVKSWRWKQKTDDRVEDKLKTYYREAEILASLNHPNIIGLEKVYITDNSIYIFQDLVTAGDLFSYIELKSGKLLDVEVAVIVRQILVALEYLHEKDIVHRDLKPENILMTTLASGCRVVLTDFGCARRLEHKRRRMLTCMGTYEYIAPEMSHEENSNAKTGGYTKAVDLWSLGCVTVVLLTGGYPFFEPGSADYSEKLANRCDLEPLERSEIWQGVGIRPKDFVRRLLVLDEEQRMTAKESLSHEWFTNDVHKTDFEELYRRAIRHWRPRMPRNPVIELIEADALKSLSFLQSISSNNRKSRGRGPQPVDPPYKPFPRRLHNQAFFPKRKTSAFKNTMSDDVKAAIENNWNFNKQLSPASSVEGNWFSTPQDWAVDKESDKLAVTELQDNSFLAPSASLQSLSTMPLFQPLLPKPSLTSTDPIRAAENNTGEAQSGKADSYCAAPEKEDFALVRLAHCPTPCGNDEDATISSPNTNANPTSTTRPGTPRVSRGLNAKNNGIDLLRRFLENPSTSQSSGYFAESTPPEPMKQLCRPTIYIDKEAHLVDKYILREASNSPTANRREHAGRLVQGPQRSAQDTMPLNWRLDKDADCERSPYSALGASSDNEDVFFSEKNPERAIIRLRRRSPTRALIDTPGIRASKMKKRRDQSILDLETDNTISLPREGKKAKVESEKLKQQSKQTPINRACPGTKTKLGDARHTSMEAKKTLDQTNHIHPLYLPRI